MIDEFLGTFLRVLTYWIFGFILVGCIGAIGAF